MSNEQTRNREKELAPWTERQGVASFILLIVLCLSFYILGIFVGRWSSSNSSTATAASIETPKPSRRSEPSNTASENTSDSDKPLIQQKKDFLPTNTEKYYIHVSSVSTQEDADKVVNKLRKVGIDSVHVTAPQPNSVAQFYVVKVGPYDVDTARQVAEELQKEHNFKGVQVMSKQ